MFKPLTQEQTRLFKKYFPPETPEEPQAEFVSILMTTPTIEQLQQSGGVLNLMTTSLNSMANNALVSNTSITLPTGPSNPLYADFELYVTFGTAPTANTTFNLWLLRSLDGGSTYEDGSSSITPARKPDGFFVVRAVTTAQRISLSGGPIALPAGTFGVLLQNAGTGQTTASSGNILRWLPVTPYIPSV